MVLHDEDVEKVAELARLGLEREEKENLVRELTSIMDYIQHMESLDLDDVEPLFNPAWNGANTWRGDVVETQAEVSELFLKGAPETRGRHIRVPRVVDSSKAREERADDR